MAELEAHGLAVVTPPRWEGRIFRRAEHGEVSIEIAGAAAPAGERSFPVVHVATIPLPLDVADYGSDVVEGLGRDDALVVLKEFDPADVAQPLFERVGMPRELRAEQFDQAVLQRRLDGQAGFQQFFQESGRAFCLYVVLGDHERRSSTVAQVNAVLASLVIEPVVAPTAMPPESEPTTTTASASSSTTTTTTTVPGREMTAPSTAPPTGMPPPAGSDP